MKIYIAAPYPTRDEAIVVMRKLEAQGHVVTSRWLKQETTNEYGLKDLEQVAEADLLLALNDAEWENQGTGGRHVEFGYALALGKRIILVGSRSNIFHHLDLVEVVSSIDEIAKALGEVPVWYNEACSLCGKPRDIHKEPNDALSEFPHSFWGDVNSCRTFTRCDPPRAAYGVLGR